jgi:hypothetical protein
MSKLKSFSEELLVQRIRLENPWWERRLIPEFYTKMKPRLYFNLFKKRVQQTQVKRAVVLMGPRRVGKTVMLFQLIQSLINEGTHPRKICFLSIDAPIYSNIPLEQLFNLCKKAVGYTDSKDFLIIFDEIQYLKDWEIHLKSLVDFYHDTRFIVSGSAAAALKLKSNESGAGRFTDFMLPPLTFHEYMELKDLGYLIDGDNREVNIASINKHFIDYINYGGYPEVIFSEQIQADPGQFIRHDIVDKVLLRDLPSLYGIKDVQELNSLFNVIAYNTGNEFNLEGLARESGVEKVTLKRYLEYLEAAFLIKIIYPVGINTKRFLRNSRFKIYLTNPSMRCALFAPASETDEHIGLLVETAFFSQWFHLHENHIYYAAWTGGEVDFVATDGSFSPLFVSEIKWSNRYFQNANKLKSLLKYCRENKITEAKATTIDKFGTKKVGDVTISFLPAAIHCYIIGNAALQVIEKFEQISLFIEKAVK